MTSFVDVNGQIFPEELAKIPAFDRGFLLGDGCFEVLRIQEGEFIFLEDHLERLFSSLHRLRIKLVFSKDELIKKMKNLLMLSGFKEAYFRLIVTRGSGLGFSAPKDLEPNVYLFIKEIKKNHAHQPLKLKLVHSKSLKEGPQIKSTTYQESIPELIQALDEGYDDILLVNRNGFITEASASNIFFFKKIGSYLFYETPSLATGILSGITRKNLISHLLKMGMEISEIMISFSSLNIYDGAFLCSSIQGLRPIESIIPYKPFVNKEIPSFLI